MAHLASPVSMHLIERALRGVIIHDLPPATPGTRSAAVYVLFSNTSGGPAVTLIRRSDTVGQHRGEYAFPGGGVEPTDRSLHDAALREVQEEIGVGAGAIEPWGGLRPEMTVTSGYLVVPFTGRLADGVRFTPAPEEVASIVSFPVATLVDPSSERTISRLSGPGSVTHSGDTGARDGAGCATYTAYAYDGKVIWGATARILAQVISAVRAA